MLSNFRYLLDPRLLACIKHGCEPLVDEVNKCTKEFTDTGEAWTLLLKVIEYIRGELGKISDVANLEKGLFGTQDVGEVGDQNFIREAIHALTEFDKSNATSFETLEENCLVSLNLAVGALRLFLNNKHFAIGSICNMCPGCKSSRPHEWTQRKVLVLFRPEIGLSNINLLYNLCILIEALGHLLERFCITRKADWDTEPDACQDTESDGEQSGF